MKIIQNITAEDFSDCSDRIVYCGAKGIKPNGDAVELPVGVFGIAAVSVNHALSVACREITNLMAQHVPNWLSDDGKMGEVLEITVGLSKT